MSSNREKESPVGFIVMIIVIGILAAVVGFMTGCVPEDNTQAQSRSGVAATKAAVTVQSNGLTVEQENIRRRIEMENKPGSIKHLYILSAYSGEPILYSTVRGKVTSSGKRLSPYSVSGVERGANEGDLHPERRNGLAVRIGDNYAYTQEVLQDDGTYGSSISYLFWFDSNGVYRQLYITGGMIVHISSEPTTFGRVTLNVETE